MYGCLYVPGASEADRIALLRCAQSFSPSIEQGADYAIAGIQGLRTLIGTPRDVALRMAAALQTSGLKGNIAVAATRHSALAAARGIPGITVIPPGDEPRALAGLPLSLLAPSEGLAATLAAWGIHTFGDLSRLPETGIAERLGQEGARLHKLAHGISPEPIHVDREEIVFASSAGFDHAVDSLESLAFILARLLQDVCGTLISHGLAASGLQLRLGLENRTEYLRSIQLPFASTDTNTLLKLLQYDLSAHPPEAAIVRVHLQAEPAAQRHLPGGLFLPSAPEPQKLEVTLARLTAVVGEGNAGSPELLNTHRPDAFRMNRFTTLAASSLQRPAVADTPRMAIRFFRPPLPAQVTSRDGAPAAVQAQGIRGGVVSYAGPWRTSGDWWLPEAWARDEWDIALDGGGLYRLFCQAGDRWFVGGNYD